MYKKESFFNSLWVEFFMSKRIEASYATGYYVEINMHQTCVFLAKCNLLGGNQECEKFCCIFKPPVFFGILFLRCQVCQALDRAIGFSFRLYIEETTSSLQGEVVQ